MTWNQPICDTCWEVLNPDREPFRIKDIIRETERCCICGDTTKSGIYTRLNPNTVPYPKRDE